MMKKNLCRISAVLMTLALGGWSFAEERTVATTVTAGTVTEFVPAETVMVETRAGVAPARYVVGRETMFVDEFGMPVEVTRITRGTPVTVRYVREGDRLLASRIVVHPDASTISKAEAKRLRDHYHDLEKRLPDGPEKARAKAAHAYYDELEEELED